jgi:hypothetical protein
MDPDFAEGANLIYFPPLTGDWFGDDVAEVSLFLFISSSSYAFWISLFYCGAKWLRGSKAKELNLKLVLIPDRFLSIIF